MNQERKRARKKIRVLVEDEGKISWERGGHGMSVRGFVNNYPCKALKYLVGGGLATELGGAVLSSMGGRQKLEAFNDTHLCGIEKKIIQDV